jgi:glucokinase
LEELCEMAVNLRSDGEAAGFRIVALGFGFGGVVRRNIKNGLLCLHEEGWETLPAYDILRVRLGLPVYIENDCKLAALAEARCGAGRNFESMFYVTIGTGIGGGFVRHGLIVPLGDSGEAEIGHIPVIPHGPPCGCGGNGCIEAVASGPGILALAGGAYASTEEIFSAWNSGDPFASAVVHEAASHIATGIASAMALLHPTAFVLGGGVAVGNPRFVALIDRLARERTVSYFRHNLNVCSSELNELAVVQGAALWVWQRLSEGN